MWNWWHGQEGTADYSFEVGKGSWIGSWISLIIALSLQSFGYSFRTRNAVGMPHIGLTDKRPVPCYTYKQLIHSSVQIKRHKVSLPHWHTFSPCMCKGQRDQCQEFGKGRGVFMCSYFCVIFFVHCYANELLCTEKRNKWVFVWGWKRMRAWCYVKNVMEREYTLRTEYLTLL